jgi:hypothetical protein
MAESAAVSSGDLATAEQYNDLRDDVLSTTLGHMHDGTNGRVHTDDTLFKLGTSEDVAVVLRSTSLGANTALTGVLEGTPATLASAANSLIIGNITDDGDVHIAVSKAGTSHTAFFADGSTGDTVVNAATGQSVDLYVAGTKEYDFSASALDAAVNNIITGGIISVDVDGTAENAAGSLTLGAGNDAGMFFDGTNLVIITNGAGASGIILDSEDDTFELKGSGTLQATFDTSGLNLVSGDAYFINATSVLNATTLGSGVTASGLTSLGAQAEDLDMNGNNVDEVGVINLIEQAEADADVAGRGQIWVNTATPNELYFTNDAGTDTQLGVSGGISNIVEDTSPQLGGVLDIQANAIAGNGGTAGILIDSTGAVTMTSQPAFLSRASAQSNVTGAGTLYTLIFNTEKFDQNADFDATSTFTAPITGRYMINVMCRLTGITSAADSVNVQIVTSNNTLSATWTNVDSIPSVYTWGGTLLMDMDASDTAVVKVNVSGEGSNVVDVDDQSWFAASLIA